MKIKCTFIYETTKYETFEQDKKCDPQVKSRKQIETNFVKKIQSILKTYIGEPDSISEIKAKIIERKE